MATWTVEKHPIAWLSVGAVVLGVCGGQLLRTGIPEYGWKWFPFVVALFYLFGVFYLFLYRYSRRVSPVRSVAVCLAAKAVKWIVSVGVLCAYAFIVRQEVLPFIVTYLVFYVVFLVVETCFFFRGEDRYKKKEIWNGVK